MIWKGVIVVLCCLTIRCSVAYLITAPFKYTKGERIFISLCWIPKATVQATLSGQFYNHAKKVNYYPYIVYG